ncbi:Patatin-like phospholipase [Agrobacterium sp. DSM 25558]|uniref:patatin-like phospholipase family protein n=1 Tax=Agrobacterium sp. DSM 25558 TaxID=1907665 RepID=UPI0009724AF6|nr:patatin-like phospholipase family protein [Agrobacterium sp. DSM 25558]SCX30043.1 Patatin-like phospholipase [Agrobacterium sp. DSM 25558]
MESQRVYCIFEGAGARGLGHLGAYRSISKNGLDIVGFAGTSAGAIVAALACSGYSADELFSDVDGSTILDLLDMEARNADIRSTVKPARTPAKLFGKHEWWKICLIRYLLKEKWIFWFIALSVIGVVLVGYFLYPQLALGLLIIGLTIASVCGYTFVRGVVRLDPVRLSLDQLLAIKIHGSRHGPPVTFETLASAGRPPLKIVAANISSQETTVFSAETTPNVPVSEAVCASIAIPGVFRPRFVDGSWFMDGGLVSNLPAWTFDDERSTDRDALTAAIEIGVTASETPSPETWSIGSALRTIIFGSGMLNKRGVDRLTPERLTVNIGLLDFDIGRTRAADIVRETAQYCDSSLIKRMIELPQLINDTCESVSQRCHELIGAAYLAAGVPNSQFKTRIAIAIPISPRFRTTRLEFSSGYDEISDERISLPIDRSLIGRAWNENQTLYVSKSDKGVWDQSLSAPQDRWLRKLIWKDLSWVLCVPLAIDDETRVVVTLDSDQDLASDEAAQQVLLDTLEDLILKEFKFLETVEKELLHGR